MAYHFQGIINDIQGVEQIVEIYRYGESGDSLYQINLHHATTPIVISHRGNNKDEWDKNVIQGIELTYTFYIPIEDVAVVEELMEADYGTYYLTFWLNSMTEVFRGLLKPENMTADYLGNPNYIEVSVNATDGLSDLKQIEFRNINNTLVKGKKTLLSVIQLATQSISNLAQDCFVYLNTYETNLMVFDQCALEEIYINCERFYEENDKGNDIMSCYDVIEAVLKPFNCKLFQIGGVIKIINYNENFVGYRYKYTGTPWSLSQKGAYGLALDITDFLFRPKIERQKIHPLKQVKTIFRNRDLGGDVTGVDLMSLSSWSHDFYSAIKTAEGYMQFHSWHTTKHSDYLELASSFDITDTNANYYLRIEMEYRVQNMQPDPDQNTAMEIGIQLKRPTSNWSPIIAEAPLYVMNNDDGPNGIWLKFDSAFYNSLELYETGAHNIRFVIRPKQSSYYDWVMLDLQIRSIRITKILSGNQQEYQPEELSIDQDYVQENTTGIEKFETEVLIGDGHQITEVGALQNDNNDLTSSWTRLDRGETVKLVDAYTRNLLANRSKYKNFLRFTVVDRNHAIDIVNSLIIQNKVYALASYTNNILTGEIEVEAIELILEDLSS